MSKILVPSICCRCGLREGTSPWEVSESRSQSYYVAQKTVTYNFVVGVCEPCLIVLQETKQTIKLAIALAYIGSIPLGIIFNKILVPDWEIIGFTQENLMVWGGALLLSLMIGLVLSLIMKRIVEESYNCRLIAGSPYSMKLKFNNSEFHRQFKALNPQISD